MREKNNDLKEKYNDKDDHDDNTMMITVVVVKCLCCL